MKNNFSIRTLTFSALLAAVYAVLTMTLPIPQYGPVQIRFAEAMCVLPFLFPAATPGLFVGCMIANLTSPYVLDVVFGSLATLLSCLWTQRLRSRWLAPLPAVVCNALIVGGEIAFAQAGFGPALRSAFFWNALNVGAGQLIACCLLGQLLLSMLYRTPFTRAQIAPQRLSELRGFHT